MKEHIEKVCIKKRVFRVLYLTYMCTKERFLFYTMREWVLGMLKFKNDTLPNVRSMHDVCVCIAEIYAN